MNAINQKTISTNTFKLLLPLLVILLIQVSANAQTFQLDGTWEMYNGKNEKFDKVATITQSGGNLSINNGYGSNSTAVLSGNTLKTSDGLTGTVSADGMKISWSIIGFVWLKQTSTATNPNPQAQTAVSLSGNWTMYGKDGLRSEKDAVITQNGTSVTMNNGYSAEETVSLVDSKLMVRTWRTNGTVSADGKRIDWSNGVYWVKQSPPSSIDCAKEGERCAFLGTADVSYGAGSNWITKTATKSIHCGVAGFGKDPAPNVLKTCVIVPKKCATEGVRCDFDGVRTVTFGANGKWRTKTFKNGVDCNVDTFGDPNNGVLKNCYLTTPEEKRINEITWLGTHNANAANYYGYFSINGQRDSIAEQLNRGARALEIDIVWDKPNGYEEGVYTCHCGGAPHTSLRGTTHGNTFRRFSELLKEIDQWLVENPNEIVFVMPQVNSSTKDQFDAEVEWAGLKTGIYKKEVDKPWATKSELIKINQRLIFQISDDEKKQMDAINSRYANPKYSDTGTELLPYGTLSPPSYGNLNEYTKDKAEKAKNNNNLLVIGAFNTNQPNELVAKPYNEYSFLNSAKQEWVKSYPDKTYFPSILQVNQIHIGDPLRFVNDINGADYLISSKIESIGDTSGDSWQIRFENLGIYNAGIIVTYFEDSVTNGVKIPMLKTVVSGVLNPALGIARMVNIPKKTSRGMPIGVTVRLYGVGEFDLYSENIPADFIGSPVPCFSATGGATTAKAGRCE